MRKTYFQGECIFKEGEPGDNAYIIVKGEVELFVLINGETKLISRLSQGSIFGEMALIDDGLRSATAVASSILEVIIITRKHFDEKVSCIDPFVNTLLKVILKTLP
ncbi:hypothetical protein VZ94_01890 [Methylocucumis oryzae]|uniref:Cyclic nucleotide-binding domain-containing protein n=1 Tax=Methylocucumis oryzae TaxID=1632867 RepID=A0A0F3IMV2_9GAMM|nr:hypothetical protein VZ94_01890 [Methylocucumis oryzae]